MADVDAIQTLVGHGMTKGKNPIKAWLKDHNFSQSWLARQLGIKRQSVSAWTTGRANPSVPIAQALVELSGGELTLEQILDPRNVSRSRPARLTALQASH